VPYPAETEIIANVVTSPHHLSATMVTGRVHRMTELFGRLAPGVDLETARADLRLAHGAMVKEHPEAYSAKADFRIEAVRLRDQITSRARTVLLVLLASSALIFVIACSNVANLILAWTVRREGELAIRAALGVPLIAGRDFNDSDRRGGEPVVIVSQSLAQRMFSTQETINRHMMWTDPVMKFIDVSAGPRRIVGVVADVNDENVVPGPAMTVYHPFEQQELWGGGLFVHTRADPYALVSPITRIIREMSADRPIERAATIEDIRAEVLAPDRLNTIVFGGFALLALAISVVGVAGVLAFSISARAREFAIRLALGAHPRRILTNVLIEGMVIAVIGVAAGAVVGFAFSRLLGGYVQDVRLPGPLPLIGSVGVIIGATVIASMLPSARAARVDVMQALRSD
jgi:hypothetical protein